MFHVNADEARTRRHTLIHNSPQTYCAPALKCVVCFPNIAVVRPRQLEGVPNAAATICALDDLEGRSNVGELVEIADSILQKAEHARYSRLNHSNCLQKMLSAALFPENRDSPVRL
eukprot:19402_3